MMPRLADTPVLQTERLTLRAPVPEDAETFIPFYATDRARFVGGPMDRHEAWKFFCVEIGHWAMRGYGLFTVTKTGDHTPLGIVGHWYPDGWPETEVGWVLFDPATEGQGVAFEAARACIDHAWTNLGWTEVVSYIAHENTRSVVLAERLGAILDENAAQPKPDKPCFVYRHPKPGGQT